MLLKNFEKLFWKEGVKLEMQDYLALDKVPKSDTEQVFCVFCPWFV